MDTPQDGSLHAPNALGSGGSSPTRQRLEQFCALVLDDSGLEQKLQQPNHLDEFVSLVVETASSRGFLFAAGDVWAAMRERSLGISSPLNSGTGHVKLPPKTWLPIRGSWQGDQLYLQWAHFGQRQLREPFFEGDVQRCLFKPFNRLFRYFTPIERLPEWLDVHRPVPPRGFIFHMSRCGSTLVSQMLAAVPHNIVISEASPIDTVVQANHVRCDLTEDQHALWLSWVVGALSCPRRGEERHVFVKLDSWHTLALPLFRRAFPWVPWIFLYRDPVEVLVSQLRMPGAQMVPGMLGPQLAGIEPSLGLRQPHEYYARVLARICEPVLRHLGDGGGGLLVDYRQLPSALWTTILPHFGLACSGPDEAAMAKVARYDAKTPSFEFAEDGDAKQQAATQPILVAAERWLGDIYRRLDAVRCNA
jgi:hypothetical protein